MSLQDDFKKVDALAKLFAPALIATKDYNFLEDIIPKAYDLASEWYDREAEMKSKFISKRVKWSKVNGILPLSEEKTYWVIDYNRNAPILAKYIGKNDKDEHEFETLDGKLKKIIGIYYLSPLDGDYIVGNDQPFVDWSINNDSQREAPINQ